MDRYYEKIINNIKHTSGVYQFFDEKKRLLYIGKALDLKKRVSQYFARPQGERISHMVEKIAQIKTIETDTNIEALILEANLINKYKPPYNILLKDDKTFGGIFITDENYPQVYSARITDQLPNGEWFGPYVSGKERIQALKILRRIFKWCDKPPIINSKILDTGYKRKPNSKQISNSKILNSKFILKSKILNLKSSARPCFYYHLGLCSGACVGAISKPEYRRQIRHLKFFLRGEKKKLLGAIEKEMKAVAKAQKYEEANRLKQELSGLKHIQESALVVTGDSPITQPKSKLKIECYDIANISNEAIVGGMAVFVGNKPDNSRYRQFKIRTITKQNDIAAMTEMVERRFNHDEWLHPDLILIDGCIGQVNAVRQVLHRKNLVIPAVGIAKGIKRNKNELVGDIAFITAQKIPLKTLINARDEAHRFARRYFFQIRKIRQLSVIN